MTTYTAKSSQPGTEQIYPVSATLRIKLSLAFFLQYFSLGGWTVTLGSYMANALKFGEVIEFAYGSLGLATIISSLFVGMLADRFFSAQKVVSVLFFLSSITLFYLSTVRTSAEIFLVSTLIHFLFFMPTVSLVNAVAFSSLAGSGSEFSKVRAFGTIGWVVGGILVGSLPGFSNTNGPMVIASVALLLAGFLSLALPGTPTQELSKKNTIYSIMGFDVVFSVKDISFWVFIVTCLLVMIPGGFYYAYINLFLMDIGFTISFLGYWLDPVAILSTTVADVI